MNALASFDGDEQGSGAGAGSPPDPQTCGQTLNLAYGAAVTAREAETGIRNSWAHGLILRFAQAQVAAGRGSFSAQLAHQDGERVILVTVPDQSVAEDLPRDYQGHRVIAQVGQPSFTRP